MKPVTDYDILVRAAERIADGKNINSCCAIDDELGHPWWDGASPLAIRYGYWISPVEARTVDWEDFGKQWGTTATQAHRMTALLFAAEASRTGDL